ncbi:probable phytanoyl-CoA dioxygenase [Anoplophora glabripennis]|uniref:probable phytanoyl-CoA dioxygenase n=1 Tax=Anoplophora glabripennis TaxID=217634 RepID=UPI0008740433|nr:probable phytanoyl-CoA dioxygenase [Anoplophora glabripennis]
MSYSFTYPNSNLSEEQKQFYEKNGYLLIKNNVSEKLLNTVCQRFIDICDGKADAANITTVMKDPSLKNKDVQGQYLINKLQDFLYDDVLWQYCSDSAVVNIVEGIIGSNITAVHSMFINKPPNADPGASLHPLHQDLHYFPFRPPNKIVASWTAVERVEEKNGCLFVVPGSHQGTLYNHEYPKGFKNSMYHGVQGFDHLPRVHVVMDKGDTVFFHPILLHGSGPNFTKGFRKAISCHYAANNCYFIDVHGTSQEYIATEIEGVAKRRGADINFEGIWKLKSRLVKGTPGNFQSLSHL